MPSTIKRTMAARVPNVIAEEVERDAATRGVTISQWISEAVQLRRAQQRAAEIL